MSRVSKHPWVLKRNLRFWPAWALTWYQNSIRLYRSCYSGHLKCDTWALTWKWVLAQDTTVVAVVHVVKRCQFYCGYTIHINAERWSLRPTLSVDSDKPQCFNHRYKLDNAVQLPNFRSVMACYTTRMRAIYSTRLPLFIQGIV